VISLGLFVFRQLRLQGADRALLDLRTFQARGFTVAIILMVVMMATLFGTIILLPIYTQDVLGLTPLTTGLLLLPGSLFMGFMGPIVGRLYDRVGPRPLLVPASILVSIVLWGMTMLSETTPWYFVLACYKLGILLEGTHARAAAGQAPPEIGDLLHGYTLWLFARANQTLDEL